MGHRYKPFISTTPKLVPPEKKVEKYEKGVGDHGT